MNAPAEPRFPSLHVGQRLAAAVAAVFVSALLLGSVVGGLTSMADEVPRLASAASGPHG